MSINSLPISRRALAGLSASLLAKPASADKRNGLFRFGLSGALDVIDPYYTGDREITIIVGEMVFDTLLYRDPTTFEHRPLLATAWRWTDKVTMELDLRPGVVWHDGQPFTADDVAYTFDYITDLTNKIAGPQWCSWIKSTEVIDPHKVRLHLREPFGPAPEYLAQVLPILPKGFYGPGGKAGANGRLVGTGPYRITKFDPGKGASFERNDKYFKDSPKGQPAIRAMAFRNIPDPTTQMAELLSGGLDWIWRMSADQTQQLATAPGVKTATGGTMRIFWVGFEARKPPFNDARVRRAVAHAIDRKALVKNLLGEGTPVLDVPCYPQQFGCIKADMVPHYDYDPTEAKRLLAEAGFPAGFATKMSIYRNSPDRMLAEAIQGYLRAVGIRAELNVTTLKAFQEDVSQEKLPLWLQSYGQYGINDVSIILPVYWGGESRDSYQDKQLIEWIQDALKSSDQSERKELYYKAEKRIIEQSFGEPLFVQNVNYAFSDTIAFKPWPDENPRFYMMKWV